jgi:hypothetical protein
MTQRRRRTRITAMATAVVGLAAAVASAYLLVEDYRWWPVAAGLGLPGFLLFVVAVGMMKK